ncbi:MULTISPECIES: DUF6452 family protein [unclassified Leeuwenhoekiella]|uniref:DUF6452 family protein n=1 Tax=unclassified Leeuwenhoekiella TaxID=2615029 RepID=UPI000C6AD6D8|nr:MULTISPECIES: DUF6452 family protein [unclassified Leeuwenhoekiella]MAW95114.1 hypothetical protein [Leeuwenhoekiella sp.]MBA79834.1 hypothetical protein [Leeuwenhoekiella sp.]|tara:strand:+ start:15830 stop:16324 length:495 start_codon:yes stop_codon:yes gene_type:complete
MLRNGIVLILLIALIAYSCERDDICAKSTPTTPTLTIGFRSNDNALESKPLNITVYNKDSTKAIAFNNASTINIPLRTDTTATVLLFEKNPGNPNAAEDPEDVDELTFTYTPQEVFISRACGYRVIFTNLEIRNNPGASRWIDDININLRTVENEDTTQVYISH